MTASSYSQLQSQLSSVWPDWKITDTLGKGTFGYVYQLVRNDLGRDYTCAMKVLQMISDESDENLEEFVRSVSHEIDMMMQLKGYPNIVTIEDYAVLRGDGTRTILIRMEQLESVEKIKNSRGGLSRTQTLQLGLDICSALVSCEEKNIIHRDIKLSNIFYSEKGGYKLGDFGISRTMDSIHEKMSMSSAGTIQYMAPEVYHGYKYDSSADLYSLGIALYILLNRNLPPLCNAYNTPAGNLSISMVHEANMRRLRGEPLPPPLDADDYLASIICTACSPDPARRFPTASSFRDALQAYIDHRPVSQPVSSPLSAPAAAVPLKKQGSLHPQGYEGTTISEPVPRPDLVQKAGPGIRPGPGPQSGPGAGAYPVPHENPYNKGPYERKKGPASGKPVLAYGLLVALIAALALCLVLLVGKNKEKDSQEEKDITVIVTYTVRYLDASDKTMVSESTVKEGGLGTTVTVQAKDLEGFTPVTEEESIRLTEDESANVVTFYYRKDSGNLPQTDDSAPQAESGSESVTVTYTVVCFDTDGNQLLSSSGTGTAGSTVSPAPPEITGYVLESGPDSLTLSEEGDNTLIYYYEPEVSEPAADLPAGDTISYKGHTYYAYETSAIDSYQEAQAYAGSRGGYLAVINDDAENTVLYDYVFYGRNLPSAYFGLSDENSEGYWEWVDGTPYSYDNWAKGQPDNQHGAEDYALFYYKDPAYTWNDGDFGKDSTRGTVIFLIEWDVE